MLESSEKDKLYTAFAQAQAEFPIIGSNQKGHQAKYADLLGCMEDVYPILQKHGLAIKPWAGEINGEPWIGARLSHASGQWETNIYRFDMPIVKDKQNADHIKQGTLTYFGRNHTTDMLGLLFSDDPRDKDLQEQRSHDTVDTKCITEKQVTYIKKLIHDAGLSLQDVCHEYGVKDISMLPMSQGSELIKALTN